MNSSTLAIIPARGGSKGLPRKNVAQIAGKPLIYWTITAALRSGACGRVIVSTEDAEIAQVAQSCGGEIPFLRPLNLAQDDTPTVDVVLHVVDSLRDSEGYNPEWIILLQPTSPLRDASDIRLAFEQVTRERAAAIVSVSLVAEHPYWLQRVERNGRLSKFLPDVSQYVRRQDLPPLYVLNGALYLIRRDVLLRERCFVPADTVAYIMPDTRAVDIDTALDFKIAESLLLSGGTPE